MTVDKYDVFLSCYLVEESTTEHVISHVDQH